MKEQATVGRFRLMRRSDADEHARNRAHSPYGLEIIENCVACPYREDRLFCNLPSASVQELSQIAFPSVYPPGAILFVEGQPARGVFILCAGRVKLSTCSIDGKTLIVRFAEPGEVLGLPSTVTGKPYSLTAEVIEPSHLKLVRSQDFLDFLCKHGEAAMRVAQQLGETYHAAVEEMRTIGLSHSAEEKVARFILDWTAKHSLEKEALKSKLTLTHEEIAEMIGLSRETVSRVFSNLRKNHLVTVKGSSMEIVDRHGLERLIQNPVKP